MARPILARLMSARNWQHICWHIRARMASSPSSAARTAQAAAAALAYLTHELKRLLAVVVVGQHRLLMLEERTTEREALLGLWDELVACCPVRERAAVQRLGARVRRHRPKLLAFAGQLSHVQQEVAGVLLPKQQALLGWAWLRRAQLEWSSAELVAALPAAWRAAARVV